MKTFARVKYAGMSEDDGIRPGFPNRYIRGEVIREKVEKVCAMEYAGNDDDAPM